MQKLASQKLDILDIGSGTPALTHSYLQKPNVLHLDISKKAFCLELTADVHHLPFRDSTFRIVYASHVLEHLEAPLDAVEEMKRVSKKYVIIKVPNGAFYKRNPEASGHIFSWNKFTFRNLLARFFDAVEIRESVRSYNPNASPFQKRIRTLKYLATSWFYSFNELTAVCVKGLFSANRKG